MLSEDRQEYERLLDEALRSAPHRPDLAAVGQRLNPDQLRAMALNATALITASAASQYQHYVQVREELRRPAPLAGAGEGVPEGDASSALVVTAVLAPVVGGTAAAIFLFVGYLLTMFDPEPDFARTLITTGWVFGAVTAVSILVAAVGLLVTALRNQRSSTAGRDELGDEVARAREAWREALMERGILPFLRAAVADPGSPPGPVTASPTSRIPHLGYSRPDFTGPQPQPGSTPASHEQQSD
ncbi:hypothetical protein [Streptomyces spinoverrucosus]|uniref:hypothetical protein n=1 Tax=Streptomyces spinoverrucosus TaxID=284043 RepID=UPI0011416B21|nr:hypothetical protein [Streptomyces spinoverrucosus]